MEIFVLRHGQAEPQRTTDEARNLTTLGRDQVAENMRRALPDLKNLQRIWASPLIRAQQTATVAKEILHAAGFSLDIETTDLIIPEANISALFDALQASQTRSLLLVSHQPFVGNFIDRFCGSAAGFHPMDTGALACIDCDFPSAGLGELRWLRQAQR